MADVIVDDYFDFLQSKFKFSQAFGFDVAENQVNGLLKPHQSDIVRWAVKKGRAAIFAAFGLGKSFMQLEVCRLILAKEGGRAIIVAPLGVRQEFRADAEKLGIDITFVRRSEEVRGDGIYITNYESIRDGKLDVNLFTVASLDEASVLRSYGSKTYQEFLMLFDQLPFRFVATATPSPNRYKELIHYAGFLGVMDTGQALTRFFQRDSSQANNLTLYPHKEKEFFLWLHSWAIFIQSPSDLGYSNEGYDLPPLKVIYHEVRARETGAKVDRDGQLQLVRDAALGLKDAAEEKRESIDERVAKVAEIIGQDPEAHYILWHDLEAERHALKKAIPAMVEVFGSLDLDEREQRVVDFSNGNFKILGTKPDISGSGPNFQRFCHKAIFTGIGYKFNDFIQAIHRIYRFLQTQECEIHIIYAETEREVLKELQRKWSEYETLTARMSKIIREHGLSTTGLETELARSIGIERLEVKSDLYHVANNDCVAECRLMESNSIDLIHTSIPFGNHYEYSASYNDFGHNEDNGRFFDQMDYLTPELLRILAPGRIAAIHVKDRIRFGNVTGYGMPSVDPFHSDCIVHYRKHGFIYMGMITVITDVVRENNQTYRLGWSEQCKDGSKMGVGSPEYVLLFRKLPTDTSRAYADDKVVKSKTEYTRAQWQVDAHAFWRSSGQRLITAEEMAGYGADKIGKVFQQFSLQAVYDYDQHIQLGKELEQKDALPATFMSLAPASHHPDVWHDVNRMRTLNGEQSQKGLNNHICPLQFDIVDRIINRYTNKGDVVFDPFGGLMTVPYRAIKLGRRGRAAELNTEYFRDGVKYLQLAEREAGMPTLFAFEDLEAAA
jgi:DNA modification methylase